MARLSAPLHHNPALYLRVAFEALHWPATTFEAAMHCIARRDIIELIATQWPQRPMENMVSISKINLQASVAAAHYRTAQSANPYPEQSAPGLLFAKCFHLEQKRMLAPASPVHAATETIAD